jgi:hypothetical protein
VFRLDQSEPVFRLDQSEPVFRLDQSECPSCIFGDPSLTCTCNFRSNSPDFKLYEDDEQFAVLTVLQTLNLVNNMNSFISIDLRLGEEDVEIRSYCSQNNNRGETATESLVFSGYTI